MEISQSPVLSKLLRRVLVLQKLVVLGLDEVLCIIVDEVEAIEFPELFLTRDLSTIFFILNNIVIAGLAVQKLLVDLRAIVVLLDLL